MNEATLTKALRSHRLPAKPKDPIWKGPSGKGTQGGVTQSFLGRYLFCKERFRIRTIEGLGPQNLFNHRLEYGNMWHCCEENYAAKNDWQKALRDYTSALCEAYPTSQEQVVKYYNICKMHFPIYLDHWTKRSANYVYLMQEKVFDIPYTLPSGRTVRLRGKWDGVVQDGKGVRLREHKTKGDVNQLQIEEQLRFDLQTMMYLIALREYKLDSFWQKETKVWRNMSILGVYYNVVRRPLGSPKHNIKPYQNVNRGKKGPDKKPLPPREETEEEYYDRLGELIKEEPEHYFMRWNSDVTSEDISIFQTQCLNPILENLCDDYEWWEHCCQTGQSVWDQFDYERKGNYSKQVGRNRYFPDHCCRHFRYPYGVYNPILEGGSSDLDNYLETGGTAGLSRITELFPELV